MSEPSKVVIGAVVTKLEEDASEYGDMLSRDWPSLALCRDLGNTGLFIEHAGEGGGAGSSEKTKVRNAIAKAICFRCPVNDEYFDYANKTRQQTSAGVWGCGLFSS